MSLYTRALRPVLFRTDPEQAHDGAIRLSERISSSPLLRGLARRLAPRPLSILSSEQLGAHFRHPIGLAAGFDKSGRGIPCWAAMGFSHVEIGSISAQPSAGNPKPRLFRIPDDNGIVVNYGLPNDGAARVAERLAALPSEVPLGINLVNTNKGPGAPADSDEEVIADYVTSFKTLQAFAAYMVLNLSCPNTCDGRTFFAHERNLYSLLDAIGEAEPRCPVLLKVAPFSSPQDADLFLQRVSRASYLRGVEINLPPGKPMRLQTDPQRLTGMPGAVSGRPAEPLVNESLRLLAERVDLQRFILIAAGGVFTAEDAYRKIRLGASLVQILTGLVYEGPQIVRRIVAGIETLLRRDGFSSVQDAVGAEIARQSSRATGTIHPAGSI